VTVAPSRHRKVASAGLGGVTLSLALTSSYAISFILTDSQARLGSMLRIQSLTP